MSTTTLQKDYKERIIPALEKEFNYTTVMQVPRLEKIVINQGLGEATQDRKIIDTAIAEQIIFPEINIDSISKLLGMNITFVTSARTDAEGYALLKHFGLPFKNAKN